MADARCECFLRSFVPAILFAKPRLRSRDCFRADLAALDQLLLVCKGPLSLVVWC